MMHGQKNIKSRFIGVYTKARKTTICVVLSVRPHGKTRLPLDGLM